MGFKTFKELKEFLENENKKFVSVFSFLNEENIRIYTGKIEKIIEKEIGKTGERNGIYFSECYILRPELEEKISKTKESKVYIYDEKWNYFMTENLNEFEKNIKDIINNCDTLEEYIELIKDVYKKI